MKKTLSLIIALLISVTISFAQKSGFRPDTIVKINGKRISATVFKVDKFSVVYLTPGAKAQISLPRKEVSHIIYRTGKVQNVSGNVESTTVTSVVKAQTTTPVKKTTTTPVTKTTTTAASVKNDSVFKRDGKILLILIQPESTDKILFYKISGKKDIFSIDKKDLSKIVYADGRVEEFAAPVVVKKDVPCDTIIHLSTKRILAQVLNVNANDVTIQKPDAATTENMPRKDIEKIIYRGSRIEEFNKPVMAMVDESSWEAVIITESASDVEGLYKRGTVIANSSSDARDVKAAKKSATIKLQKKAAGLKANIVLITRQEAKGGYGEIPGYEIEGVAYGFEPSGEETLENAPK